MLSIQDRTERASPVVHSLGEVSARDAIGVLQCAIAEVLQRSDGDELNEALPSSLLPRRAGRPSVIEQDDEIRAFIHTFTSRDTIHLITNACKAKFGAERAPSSSSVGRYLRSLAVRKGGRG